jgi:DNA-binding NtrC family response regulator
LSKVGTEDADGQSDMQDDMIELKLDIPADIFDAEFPLASFSERMREVAILELVRVKRMHEHEALELLGLDRRELLEKMKASGIVPTENAFEKIKGELEKAIKTRAKK